MVTIYNSNNNCNDQNQNVRQNNECKIEIENKDHSDNNLNSVAPQTLICTTIGILKKNFLNPILNIDGPSEMKRR